MKHILILYCFLFIGLSLKAQNDNLIHNSGFEFYYDESEAGSIPNEFSQITRDFDSDPTKIYISEWRSRTRQAEDANDQFLHSPEWFRFGSGYYSHAIGAAQEGNSYVGMFPYELVQQKFHQALHMKEDTFYILRMYVQLSNLGYGGGNAGNFSDVELKVYVAKNNIEYKWENKYADQCTENYITHENGVLQDIKPLHTFQLNVSDYPYSSGWHMIEAIVQGPKNAQSYDWFAIETRRKTYDPVNNTNSDCQKFGYLLIDNVSLKPFCQNPCAPHGNGPITFNIPANMTPGTQPWTIVVKNALGYKLELLEDNSGSTPFYVKEEFNPNGLDDYSDSTALTWVVYWNGHNQNTGNIVPNTSYNYYITAWNCDYSQEAEGQVQVHPSPEYPPFPDYPPQYCTAGCTPAFEYQNCCWVCRTFNNPPPLQVGSYTAEQCIIAENNYSVPSGYRISFTAGEEVTLKPGFTASSGSKFIAAISPACTAVDYRLASSEDSQSEEFNNPELNTDISNIVIAPNPNNGLFYIRTQSINLSRVIIFNALGEKVYESQISSEIYPIDLNDQPSGVYLVRIEKDGEVISSKIIID